MNNWIEKFEQIIKNHQFLSIILFTVIGSLWGIWHSVSQEINNPVRQNELFPDIKLEASYKNLKQIRGIVFFLFIHSIIVSPIIFIVISCAFFVLNKVFEFVFVQIFVAISVSSAITRRRGNLQLLDAFMGGFDLKGFQILGSLISSIFESYEKSYAKHFKELKISCDKIFDNLIEEKLEEGAKQAALSAENCEKDMQTLEVEIVKSIEDRLLHWDESAKPGLQKTFEQIKGLPDEQNRKISLLRFKDKIYGKD